METQRGFTLIEIMVVVVIIGILSAILAPTVIEKIDRARIEAARTDLRTIEMALKYYRMDNHAYPDTSMGLEALVVEPPGSLPNWNPDGYLDARAIPKDPWGHAYVYESPGPDGLKFRVMSLGADGRPGGEGVDGDIVVPD